LRYSLITKADRRAIFVVSGAQSRLSLSLADSTRPRLDAAFWRNGGYKVSLGTILLIILIIVLLGGFSGFGGGPFYGTGYYGGGGLGLVIVILLILVLLGKL
jgi:hypothetical protein